MYALGFYQLSLWCAFSCSSGGPNISTKVSQTKQLKEAGNKKEILQDSTADYYD